MSDVSNPTDLEPQYGDDDFDFEAFFAEHFNHDVEEDSPEEYEPVPGEFDEDDFDDRTVGAEPPSPPEAGADGSDLEVPPDVIRIGNAEIPADSAEQVATFWAWMNENPQQAVEFMGYLMGDYELAPKVAGGRQPEGPLAAPGAPTSTPPVPDEDWEYLPESVRQRLQHVDMLEQRIAQHDELLRQQYAEQQAQQIQRVQSAIEQGVGSFRTKYDVDDDTLERLKTEAGRLGLAGTLAAQYGDQARGVAEALELAYLRDPALRERELARQTAELQQEREKQKKLASLGGSSAQAPTRSASQPSTPEEVRAAMVDEIRRAQLGAQ